MFDTQITEIDSAISSIQNAINLNRKMQDIITNPEGTEQSLKWHCHQNIDDLLKNSLSFLKTQTELQQ